jgi:predicted kinase
MDSLFIPQHGLNLSRTELPQVAASDLPDYLNWMKTEKNISSTFTDIPVSALYPSQGNFNQEKIKALMTKDRDWLRRPILISGDHFLLDGHHRWLALLNLDDQDTIPAFVLHANILDAIAATKDYPKAFMRTALESFNAITEAAEKHAVLSYGRMNPPTTGHAKLVDKVHEVAKKHNASHLVVLSHSQDAKKNPLTAEQKVKHAKRYFPHTNIKTATKSHPTIFHHAADLYKSGVKHLHVVVGADRQKEFHEHLHKYNGHFDKEGHGYKFKSITVHSAGARDPHAKGTEGMSASKMRHHASTGNFHEFKKGVPSHVSHEHAKELYHDVRKGMGHLKENSEDMEYLRDPSYKKLTGKYPTGTSKKPNPRCKECGGTGYVSHSAYGVAPSRTMSHSTQCDCTHLKEEMDLLSEAVQDHGIFKAVFLAGAPGSGKDIVLRKALQGHGMTEISSDAALQHLGDKEKLDSKMSESEQERRNVHKDKSKSLAELRQRLAIHGRNGLIINSTANHAQIKKIKDKLTDLGYDTKMVFVDASDNVSRNRNVERGQKGGRMIPEKVRAEKWRQAQDARVKLSKEFGGENYHEFNNDEDLRHNTDVAGQKTSELQDLNKTVKKFAQQPPKSEQAQAWMYKNVNKLAKMPVGNKKQQAGVTAPPSDSKAREEAQKLGLTWLGHGRYGKGGRVTHFALHDRLVEKQKALKVPDVLRKKESSHPKQINEQFEQLFTEDSYEHMGLGNNLENSTVVGGSENAPSHLQHFSDALRKFRMSPGSQGRGKAYGSLQEEKNQEPNTQRNTFGQFMARYINTQKETLQEGEPTKDLGGDGGPILGGSPAETLDTNNGGVATSGPKKTLKQLREKK